jgi:lipopolysaccharide biosynthesis regulator YciM
MDASDAHTGTRDLEAAEGYLMLGMFQHAWNVLEALPQDAKRSKRVLVLHLDILTGVKEWPKAALLAQSLCVIDPADVALHVRASCCWEVVTRHLNAQAKVVNY